MATLPTDTNDSPNYTSDDHATHHNTLHGLNNQLGNFTQSASAPGSPASGDLWLDTDENAANPGSGTWTTWSPTLANLTLGNGSVLARYSQIGKTVHYRFVFTLGSTSAVGTNPTFTLPVAEAADYVSESNIGTASLLDSGTAVKNGGVRWQASGVAMIISWDTNNQQASLTSTVPFTWVTGDKIFCAGTYEAA